MNINKPKNIDEVEQQVPDCYDLNKVQDGAKELTRFDIWERKLLDFSLRNSLLNLYLRRKAVQFISFDVNHIEDYLQEGKEYVISPKPDVEFSVDTTEKIVRSKLCSSLRELVTNDIDHFKLHTYQTEAESKNTLKNIYRAARNAIEETGANSLFLVIGTLRWYETPRTDISRYAPLLLLPVEMVYKRGNYYIRTCDGEISLNITLMEFLRQNYDIHIEGLDPLPTDPSGVDVPMIFKIIREALKNLSRWELEEECVLGVFSFSKFLMWNDIHSHREQLLQNKIIESLVCNRLTWVPEPIADNLKDIDLKLSPIETALPVTVDSSQMAAVIEAGKAHSFILYGPPGTGKSQTITNLIANALYQGKRVLFVAEKMAALSVVQKRLAKIGLDPFCLELHSNKTTKRHVLEQLDKALKVTHIRSSANFKKQAEKIFEERKSLIACMNALHSVDKQDGLSLYDCILRYESIAAQPLEGFMFSPEVDSVLSTQGVKAIEELLGGKLESVVKLIGQPSEYPLNGLHLDKSMVMNSGMLVREMQADCALIEAGMQKMDELNAAEALREELLRDNTPALFDEDGTRLHEEWRKIKANWFIPFFFAKRKFIKRLRSFNAHITEREVDKLIHTLIAYQMKHSEIAEVNDKLSRYFGMETNADRLPSKAQLEVCVAKLRQWTNHVPEMRDWLHWSQYSDELTAAGMGCVVTCMQKGTYNPPVIRDAYLKALFKYKAECRIRASESLATFEGMLFDENVAAYRRMTDEFQMLTQLELYARLAAKVPRVTDGLDNSSEIGLLNRNISNGGRGLSLRDLFEQLPTLMPRLCPCMLMSPMSVAQYIDMNGEKFDIVIFDEASQMPTSEAVGAIARGKSLIVVGDPKQMPPTSFFSTTNVDEEEAAIDDMESILEDCRTLEIPSLQLSWHYRSRHESLIAFSNNEYYEGSLITFPSVDDGKAKVHYVPIEGYYDKGGKRQNPAEAEAIVKEIERRLKDESLRKKSIGVIAFSVVQQSLIEDVLQAKLDKDKALHDAAEQMYEPIFVKNLENVQGDERDVILFSIGYGPDKEGKVSMNFGPLNNSGGERRLNVAVSRAREEMYIYSTLNASQIDLHRSKARGVEGLKHFLEYAESQSLTSVSAITKVNPHDAILAEQIAAKLREKGYTVQTNVGRSRFKINVAVCDINRPGVYRLGLLLDGEGYRDTHTTRDREIVQPSVLSGLHWKTMRVWSVDWFNNPERVISRIEECLATDEKEEPAEEVKPTFDISNEQVEEVQSAAKTYKFCEMKVTAARRMADADLVRQIIATEQPISFMYLCRRVCALRDSGRVTPAVQQLVSDCLYPYYQDMAGDLWLTEADCMNYAHYRTVSGRNVTDIPQAELIVTLGEALKEQVALQADNLIRIAAEKLGFTRRGSNVEAAFKRAIDALLRDGKIEQIGEKLRLAEGGSE